MPPQPLSRVRRDATVDMNPGTALRRYPGLMLLVMSVIQTWARIDVQIISVVTTFLKADFLPVAAMMQALSGAEGKRAAILAAATQSLSKENLDLFNAVMIAIGGSRKKRNDFTHHFWAISPEIDDALVLIDPKHLIRDEAIIKDYNYKFRMTDTPPMDWDDGYRALPLSNESNAFLYKRADLIAEEKQANSCHGYVILLGVALQFASGKPDQSEPIRQRLLEEPPVLQALQQLTSGSAP